MFKLFIANLKEGLSQQERSATPSDLGFADDPDFQNDIRVVLDIEKVGRNIFVNAGVHTQINMICDRCAEPFTMPITDQYRLLFTSDPDMQNDQDESVLLIPESFDEVDLSEPLHETLVLALPFKRLCQEECKGLCDHCGQNLNEKTCHCKTGHIDPRWNKLKTLLS